MAEQVLSVDSSEKVLLGYISNKIKNEIKLASGVQFITDTDDRSYLSLGYKDIHSQIIQKILKDSLCDIFSISYKKKYLINKLNIKTDTLLKKTLINTLSIFDLNYDKKLINNLLPDIEDFSIDGFYNFRLQSIKERWDEIIGISLNNDIVLNNDDVMKEFLIFLIDTIPPIAEEVYVNLHSNDFMLLDSEGHNFERLCLVGDQNQEEILLYNLICISPKLINFTTSVETSKEFVDILESFFKVKYIKNNLS